MRLAHRLAEVSAPPTFPRVRQSTQHAGVVIFSASGTRDRGGRHQLHGHDDARREAMKGTLAPQHISDARCDLVTLLGLARHRLRRNPVHARRRCHAV
eukprot:2881821-Pyramimonas_sp.AAC.1